MRSRDLAIPYTGGELAARLYSPPASPMAGAVISHGLYSSKDSEKLNEFAKGLAQTGCLTLIFDHEGCGDSPGDVSRTTLTGRRDQFLAATAVLQGLGPRLPLVYMGSSLGGATALLAAQHKPPLCSLHWSTPWDFAPLAHRLADEPDTPPLPLFVDDAARYDFPALLSQASRMFFAHGQEDELVPVEQARLGHRLCREPKGLLTIPGGDHRLSDLEHQALARQQSLAWVERFLDADSVEGRNRP